MSPLALLDAADSIYAPAVAKWIRAIWGELPLLEHLAGRVPRFAGLPQTLVAVQDSQPVGTVSLLNDDMPDRSHFNPWMGCLYVVPHRRLEGIGRLLVRRCIRNATELGVGALHLFCAPSLEGFYASEGWIQIERRVFDEEDVLVMRRSVT